MHQKSLLGPKIDNNTNDTYIVVNRLKEKAKIHFYANQYKKAIDGYTRALDCCPKDDAVELSILYSNRSAAYYEEKKFDASLHDAQKIVILRPNWTKGYFRRGNAEAARFMLEEAMVSFGKALVLLSSEEESDPSLKGIHDASYNLIQTKLYDVSLAIEERNDGLYFKQLIPGRDICLGSFHPVTKLIHEIAKQMKNIVYLVGDRRTNQCVVIDMCWDVDGIIQAAQKDGMRIVGALITHYHVDHVGGRPPPPYQSYGIQVPGIKKFISQYPCVPVFMHPQDIPYLRQQDPDMPVDKMHQTMDQQEIFIGGNRISLKVIHTPGHTKGSQCFLIHGSRLITGDTLFIHACGRTDLSGGDIHELYISLQYKLRRLSDSIFVYPGHAYNGLSSTIWDEKERGLLKKMTFEEFIQRVHNLAHP